MQYSARYEQKVARYQAQQLKALERANAKALAAAARYSARFEAKLERYRKVWHKREQQAQQRKLKAEAKAKALAAAEAGPKRRMKAYMKKKTTRPAGGWFASLSSVQLGGPNPNIPSSLASFSKYY